MSISRGSNREASGGESNDKIASQDDTAANENEDIDDKVLSQELMNMSVVDRNAILEEIHGAACLAIQETPELIQKSLKEFQEELDGQQIHGPSFKRSAYRVLLSRQKQGKSNPNYALEDNFRLRFLRCELFDVTKAVRRFCNYLDYAYEYWGNVALERPIRLTDFSKAELKVFRKGYFQLLPFRDSSGRRVMVFLGGMDPHKDLRARNKITFYLWDVVTRDSIESQQKGFVIIRLHGNVSTDDSDYSDDNESTAPVGGSEPISFRSVTNNLNRSLASIPSRLIAAHTRIPNHPGFRLVYKLFLTQVFTKENISLRPRFVACLADSDLETRYQLKSYGIPSQVFPITDTDSIKCVYHNQWMKTRKLLEEENDSSEDSMLVECPGLNDVVFRKGSKVTSIENPGNRLFRDLIRTFLEEKERVAEQLRQEESEEIDPLRAPASFETKQSTAKPAAARTSPPALSPATSTSSIDAKKNTGKAFCDWLVDYIEQERKGRFLEWNNKVNGWVVMSDKIQTSRKASITLYNWGKRLHAERMSVANKERQERLIRLGSRESKIPSKSNINYNTLQLNNNTAHAGIDDNSAYRFIDGPKPLFQPQEPCCITSAPWINPVNNTPVTTHSPVVGRKRPRNDDFFPRVNKSFPQQLKNIKYF